MKSFQIVLQPPKRGGKKETYQGKLKSSKTAKGVSGPTKSKFVGVVSFIVHIRFFLKIAQLSIPLRSGKSVKQNTQKGPGSRAANLGASDISLTSPGHLCHLRR